MKTKRMIAGILSATFVLGALAACGGTSAGNSTAPAASGSAAAGAAELVWAGWSGEEEGSKAIFEEMRTGFETESGNTVKWVGWPWADTAQQLLIRNQGNEQLDIAQVDISIFATLAEAGVLADLNEVVGESYFTQNFEEAALAVGNREGKQLAMPWSMASISMVYNPEILAKAGWQTPPATVEEFEKCLADVAAMDSSIIPYAVATKDATIAGDFAPWLWTFGGAIYDEGGNVSINSAKAVECVEWYQGLLANNYIRMDMSRFDARQLFAQGKVAFYDDAVVAKGTAVSNGVDPANVSEVCSAMLRPVVNSGDAPQSVMWGHMLVVFDKSEVKTQAADFAKYLVSEPVAMNYFENNGMPPVLKAVIASDTVQNDAYAKGFMNSTETARLEETALMAKGAEVKTIIVEELQAALLNSKTAQQAMDDAATRIAQVK
ncbi:MAG: ABC transporter substrate-binding protein [Oscillospiraceae bacterium]